MFGVTIQSELTALTKKLEFMWNLPRCFCHLNYTNLTMTGFKVDWQVKEFQKEVDAANLDLCKLQIETTAFLQTKAHQSTDRQKRAILVAAAALRAIGLFGVGISMSLGSCGHNGIFGSCQAEDNADAKDRVLILPSQSRIMSIR